LWLTSFVVLCLAWAIGLGLGHFLGWNERLELQEYYSEVREEKMEELTDSLVNCMTSNEGNKIVIISDKGHSLKMIKIWMTR